MSKKRNKKYRPRDLSRAPMIVMLPMIAAVFNPLYRFLDEIIECGTVDTIDGKEIVTADWNNEYYKATEAFTSIKNAFEIWMRKTGAIINLEPIGQLIARLEYSAPVTDIEAKRVKGCLDILKSAMRKMTLEEAEFLYKEARIKELMEMAA